MDIMDKVVQGAKIPCGYSNRSLKNQNPWNICSMKNETTSLHIVIVQISRYYCCCVATLLCHIIPYYAYILYAAEKNKHQTDSSGTCGTWPEHMLQDPMEVWSQVASGADPLRDLSCNVCRHVCEQPMRASQQQSMTCNTIKKRIDMSWAPSESLQNFS